MSSQQQVLVTGGAGYVGSVLVPQLLNEGYRVKVLDLFIYGEHALDALKEHPNLEQIKGDIRDSALIKKTLPSCDTVIHLACISNDPSFELDPELGKSINYDAFIELVKESKENGIQRFIYASSSSVYGIKEVENVTEDLALEPLTDYSKYKAMCEEILLNERDHKFKTLVIRPATVCGYSPRLRLDLTVNILTNHAVNNRKITVFGGDQMRPNIHIKDMCRVYLEALKSRDEIIDGEIFNAGYDNRTVMEIAEMTRNIVGEDVEIIRIPTNDNRSYHISSEKIKQKMDFVPQYTIEDAIHDLVSAFDMGKIPEPMNDIRYYNIKKMQALGLR
ncbi:MAG: NAD-dependent epimerase/dehydratase family protein [Chloroflexi bacterium]|nr:NAD-dependent epimerase/dehydratase family protein [Chloroflexota bacterium]